METAHKTPVKKAEKPLDIPGDDGRAWDFGGTLQLNKLRRRKLPAGNSLLQIEALFVKEHLNCPECGAPSNFRLNGRVRKTVADTPLGDNAVHYIINVQRFVCKECSKSFQDELKPLIIDDDAAGGKITTRLAKWLLEKALTQNTTRVSIYREITEKTAYSLVWARKWLQGRMPRLKQGRRPKEIEQAGTRPKAKAKTAARKTPKTKSAARPAQKRRKTTKK